MSHLMDYQFINLFIVRLQHYNGVVNYLPIFILNISGEHDDDVKFVVDTKYKNLNNLSLLGSFF